MQLTAVDVGDGAKAEAQQANECDGGQNGVVAAMQVAKTVQALNG